MTRTPGQRILRFLKILTGVIVVLLGICFVTYRVLRGPDPNEILASIERPPSPTLTPKEALDAFRVAPGFRVELVAAEPLVVDPVAMDWDDEGRLYVVEMRGFMLDVEGEGEEQPIGRVVRLEDRDGDGRMDSSQVFASGLVLPRAIAVLPDGVLIAEPPHLLRCRDTTGDGVCDEKTILGDYAVEGPNLEHQENGLLAGIDGWLYNAKSDRRLRVVGDRLEQGASPFRGQWGIAQDDEGLLYYNHNSAFLYGEVFPGEYTLRQAATGARSKKHGINVALSDGAQVFGVRVAPGLNRAYASGSLRPDGRVDGPTAVSGLVIQRGDQYGEEWKGDAFVPESAGNAVAHFSITRAEIEPSAEHRLYPDEEWGEREFLASTDERFRPVDAKVGPDGTIWIIDMYRGVIQHAFYVSDYLRDYVEQNDLVAPGAHGRIWRVVREDRPIDYTVPSLVEPEAAVEALDHPNGWVRDRASRRLVHEADAHSITRLRALDQGTPLGRVHAVWTLARLGELDSTTWERALGDGDARVRRAALRAGEGALRRGELEVAEVAARLDDPDPLVRLQVLHTLGEVDIERRPLDRFLSAGRTENALERQAVLSGLAGAELAILEREIERREEAGSMAASSAWLAELAPAVHRAAQTHLEGEAQLARLLDLIQAASPADQVAMLGGIARAQRDPGGRRMELATAHPIFAAVEDAPASVRVALAEVRPHITWPGDPRPGGARALTEEEETLRVRGETLYANSCASCHGPAGIGNAGLAPSLVGSPWVRNADEWLVRIALHGLTGPITIETSGAAGSGARDQEEWNSTMPGHGADPRFDDESVAGLLTFLRRAWGHGDDPVSVETVSSIRRAEEGRNRPWTVAELEALPITHRLDRYRGTYSVPLVPISLVIDRAGNRLTLGRGSGASAPMTELGRHTFSGEGLTAVFEEEEAEITGAQLDFQGTSFTVSRAR